MRLTMPKQFIIPEQKFVPNADGTASFPSWLHAPWHPPYPGKVYMVKNGVNGIPYHAWFDWSQQWWTIEENVSGQQVAGTKILSDLDLYFVARL